MKKEAMRHLLWLAGLLVVIILAGAIWGGRLSEKYEEAAQQAAQEASATEPQPNDPCNTPKPSGPSCGNLADYTPAGSFLNPNGTIVKDSQGRDRKMFCTCDKFGTTTAGDSTGCNTIECNCFERPENVPRDSRGRLAGYIQGKKQTLFLHNMYVDKDVCVNNNGTIIYRDGLNVGNCPSAPTTETTNKNRELLQKVNTDIKAVQAVRAWEDQQKACPAKDTAAAQPAQAASETQQSSTAVEAYHNIEPFANEYASCY